MDAPSASDVGGLLPDADLPALEGEPLEGLLRRLDREADLWRQLSLRALSRAGWADRVGQLASVGAWLVCATSAVLAALRGLVGAERPLSAIALSTVSLAVVLLATAVVAWVGASVRRTQGALARAAIERADLAELRLQRLAVLLALRREDPAAFQRALLRLEGDARVAR
jgi:hypothetical protein